MFSSNIDNAVSSPSESSSSPTSPSGPDSIGADERESKHLENSKVTDAISTRVAELANQSENRTDFLRSLAAELLQQFQSGVVAVNASTWTNPMMLVTDDDLAQCIERSSITELLSSASRSPIACSIPQVDSEESARGLRIELTEGPDRTTILLVYPIDEIPGAIRQVSDLQRLNRFAESTRQIIETIGLSDLEQRRADQNQSSSESSSTHPSMIHSGPSMGEVHALSSFHQNLDLTGTAYRIANESRRLLSCDRATVLVPHGRGLSGKSFRVIAVSGVAVVDRRSNSIKAVERLVRSAVVLARPLVLPSDDQPLPPQIQQPLDEYLDESGVLRAVLLPLYQPALESKSDSDELLDHGPFDSDGDLVGILVLEHFSGESSIAIEQRTSSVANAARLALGNSIEHRSVFGLGLWKAIGRMTSPTRAPVVMAATVLAVGLFALSLFIRIEHQVIVSGHIEPSVKRQVFAPLDGTIKELMVVDGQTVEAGDPLLRLENAELESQAESLAGEILTANKRLTALAAMRLSDSGDVSASARLAMEERQLQSELTNLIAQQAIVKSQQENLIVTAPISGNVAGWQMERRLMGRPVGRGNSLLQIVDPASPWDLQLNLPDEDAGPVLAAATNADQPLRVEFAVATLPEKTFSATLGSIATAARLDSLGSHVIDARARVIVPEETSGADRLTPNQMRSGADVTAKISCGERTILRSWFGDVFDFVHRNILFYF